MVSTMHTQAKQHQLEKQFQQACDIYSTILILMEEQGNSNDTEMAKISVDYASALIDNYIDEKLNAAKKDNEAIVNKTEEEGEENQHEDSENSYGDDPILGNPVVIKTNDDEIDEKENKDAIIKHDDATDIEIAWEILEVARLKFEQNPEDQSSIHYMIKIRNLLALIYKENENPEESLRESFECKQLYKTHNISDPRLYAAICYNRAFCYLLLMNSQLATLEYTESMHALESILTTTQLTDTQLSDIQDIIQGIQAQLEMCKESNVSKDSLTNNIREFIQNWSNIPATDDNTPNSFNATSQLKPEKRNTDPNDISHLVKKKKD